MVMVDDDIAKDHMYLSWIKRIAIRGQGRYAYALTLI